MNILTDTTNTLVTETHSTNCVFPQIVFPG